MTGPCTEWTFRDLDHLVDERPRVKKRQGEIGYPMPNSSQFVFPMMVAPEAFSRWTTVASNGD